MKSEKKANKNTILPVNITPAQRDWVKNESVRTGETMTAVIRRLIQNQIEG